MEKISDCIEERYFGGLFTTECERFGMMNGCRIDCPVFERGDCKNEDTINQFSKQFPKEIFEIYPQTKTK